MNKKISILSTSDVHGYIASNDFLNPIEDYSFGLSRATTALHDIEASASDNQIIIKIENGDFIQGSPLANYIAQKSPKDNQIFSKLIDYIDYDVTVLGNHEFNFGKDYILDTYKNSSRIINSNILDADSGLPFIGTPYKIIERNGVKIGIIGSTIELIPMWEHPDHIRGLIFENPIIAVKKYLPQLKKEADVILVAYHGGFERDLNSGKFTDPVENENRGYQILKDIPEIDALITGHQHRTIAQQLFDRPTTQPGYRGSHIGAINLELDSKNNIVSSQAELIATNDYKQDSKILDLIKPIMTKVEPFLDQQIGSALTDLTINNPFDARLSHHPYIELINQIQMDAVQTDISAVSLFNDWSKGFDRNISYRQVVRNYPYPNNAVAIRVSGQDIKNALEFSATYFIINENNELTVNPKFLNPKKIHYDYDVWSGIDYQFDFSKPEFHRVSYIKYHGQDLIMDQQYEIALNNYRAAGSGGIYPMYSTDKIVRENQLTITELIAQYIQKHSPLDIKPPHNFQTIGYEKTNSHY